MTNLANPFSLCWWIVILSLSLTPTVTALGTRPFSRGNDLHHLEDQADLTSLLHSEQAQDDGVFSQALQLLESLNSSPSCNRIAASRLLTSCQSIKGGSEEGRKDTAEALDFVKSLYAARLAVCELTGAGATLPTDCSPVTTSPRGYKQALNSHQDVLALEEDRVPPPRLERCLKSLESRPQWWTSYSNSRQNAVVMCQAARIEIDKEELLSLHKTLTETTSNLTRELADALQKAAAESSRNIEFVEAVETMRVRLEYDLEESSSFVQGLFSTLFHEVEGVLRNSMNSIVSTLKGAGNHAEALNQKLEESNNGVNDLKDSIRSAFEGVAQRSTDFSTAHKRDLEANQELAVAVQRSLDSIKKQNLDEMAKEFNEIHFSLEAINQLVASMYYKQNSLGERLQTFDESFQKFEQQAGNLRATHSQHADEQLRLQESVRLEIQIARALLDEVTAAAANLQSSVEETSTSFVNLQIPGTKFLLSGLAWICFYTIIWGLIGLKIAFPLMIVYCMWKLSISRQSNLELQLNASSPNLPPIDDIPTPMDSLDISSTYRRP
ncbi:hypothetical protein FQN54_007159 [Arachnomyces sp. PD_36]|nr:hypothetical protein FQN54_007159 [Arachnomyces sp. PD_36]